MEFLGGRLPFTQFQEEKYQMLELNQRLESYLGHVKLLEEENKLLREEIHTLKSSKEPSGQRKAQEEALSQARRMLEEAWRKKDHVVLEVENLMEDIEVVSIQRQKAKNAKAEAQRKLMESRKELEEERRAQIWLREKAGQLEKDLLLQMQVHQENMETSQASLKQTKQVLMAPHPTQTTSIPDLGQEYSHRAAQAWQEATNNYQRLFGRLEESLNQAKANMAKIHQEKRENQHQVQHLAKELESTKTKRQMLEKNVVQQREEHTQELQHLQAQVDALELEKDNLGQQIDSLMVDRQNLLQAKMSLGLEVATYRALLDSEGLRTDRPTTKKTSSAFFLDVLSKPTGTRPASQTTAASCNVSNTVSTSHRSITSSRTLLTRATPSWSPTQGTPQRTPTRTSVTEKTEVHISEETEKAAEESVDHLQQEKVHEGMVLAITLPKTAAEPEPQLKPEDTEIKEDEPIQFKKAQVVECKTDASALISVSADQPSNLYQTPETESWAGPFTDPAGGSEEGKDEDTEVSFEMAQISHAPKVAWEQNKSVADDEKNDASEMDARSENISESRTFACEDAENDDETLKSTHISANTNIMGSSFLEQGTLDLVGDFGYHEDLMKVNKQDNVSNISEEGREQMNSETDAAIDSINEWDRQEEIEPQNEMKVVSPDSEEEEEDETNIVADTEDKKEDENVTEREEEVDVIKSDFSVLDEGIDSPKNSDHQESLEKTVLPTEPHSDQTVNEEDPLKPEDTEIKEDEPIQFNLAQMVECKTDASALISVSADQPSNLYQTPETESWAGPFTDPAGDSEEGKDEDTEVSFEMAQISHAPTVAWEENKTVGEDEKDDASEMDVRSENISGSHTFACEDAWNDEETLKSSHISANTNIMGSSFLKQGTLDLVGDFGYHEDLLNVDKQDNVSNISEEGREQMNSETEAVIYSINELDKQEAIEPQNEVKVVSPDSEEEEENETNIVADTEDKKEDENVTEREEEEEIDLIKSDFSVLDEGIDSPKNSDHQESLEKTVLPTEPHSDQTVNEEDPLKPEDTEIKEDEPIQFNLAQMVECKTDASALISVSADQPSNLYQTPETESWAGPFTDPAGDSEEGKDEDTEVSFEMAQISHAPTVAWEENKTVGEDEKDDVSEMDVRSENISGSHTFACEDAWNDEETLKSSHISANTNIMGSSFLKQGTLDLVGDFGYHEDLMKVDKQDNVSNISEEGREQMNSETEAVIDSINEWDRQEEIEPENEMKVVSPDSEEEEDETNIVANTEDKKEDENVTEREEEEEIDVIKSDFSVLDEGVDSPKNSDHQESLEKTVLSTEPHSDQTVNEEDPLKPEDTEIKGDEPIQFKKAQVVECKTDASALISVLADQPSNLYQTPETESRADPFTDPAGDSEEGKDEDTELSFEMAQISHAPKVAWEENKTVAEDEKDDTSEMDVRSENISESHTFACEDAWNDEETLKSSHISANTNIMGSSFLEQGTLDLVGEIGYHEDLMKVDKQDNVSNISEEGREQMNSETEAAIDSINEWDRQEEIEPENEMKVVSPDSEEEEENETNVADTKDKKEDENVTEREEEIEVIKSDFSVLDEGVDSPKNSDHQESLEKTVLPTELHSDQTVNEEDPLKPEDTEIKGDEPIQFNLAQMVECKTDASALISVSADQPSNLYQTPETESRAGPFTDPAGDSEGGKDEDTKVSFEMAQISHAPMVAWEENKTVAEDRKNDATEMDVRSENISESHTFACEDAWNDNETLKSSHISANTSIMGSSFLEQGTLDLVGDFGYHEDLMNVDKHDNVSNISEEGIEQMNSESDAAIDSINEWDRQEEIEPENEMKVVSPDSDEEEEDETNIVADTKDKKEDENVTEREEEIKVIKSDFSVLDEGVDSPKNSDHQESLEKTVLPTEPHSDQTVNEEDPLKPEDTEIKEDEPIQFKKAQMVECKTYASALTTVSADQPSNLYQTPETESGAGPFTDPAGDSEEGKDEDTEVCFEMAQISHTPTVAWEQNKTIAEDEKDDASEMDVKSENISESHRFAYEDAENDDDTLKSTHISANTNIMGSSFLEQGTLDLVGDFGYHEDLMKVDKQDNVSNISEEGREQMNSETEAVIDSINEWDRQEAIEPENEMKVVSPDSEEEEENETNIVADTEDKKEDENVTEREEEEVEVIKSDFSVLDEGIDSPKNSDHQESLEKTVLPTELHSDQTVNEEDYLPEESEGEEENQGEDDDSPNITSWRTDPGEYDSYSQENTIADTRPLIRYKSDEETNGNVLTSHLISETSDSEDEKERMEGGHWNDSASKCFNTMEDLAEEPDLEVTGEMMTEDVVSKEEVQEGDRVCIMLQSDSEVHESLDMVEKESARIELKVNLEEDSDVIKEIRKDEDHNVKVYEQPQLTENQLMHTEQPEDETVHSYESQKHPISFPETSHQLKNLFETPSTLTMFQDSAATKDPEDFLDVSMHTSMDLTESRSLESKISSQPDNLTSDIPNSDQEEGNSSEDESPNASQCFQNTSLLKVATLNEQPFTFTNGVSKADSVSDVNNLPEEVLSKEKNTEEPKAAQIDDWENSNIWSKSINAPDAAEITHASTIDENTGVFPVNVTESLDIPNKMAENIFGKFEEHLERTVESFSEKVLTVMDFESTSSGEKEELQSKEKKSEIHSFFSTSMKEDFWSQGEMEMAANYDPAETEDLNQAMVFGEEWRDMEGMPMANVSPKEKMDILKGQDEKHKDEQPTQSKMVLSYDSVDEEDSWSSGDE